MGLLTAADLYGVAHFARVELVRRDRLVAQCFGGAYFDCPRVVCHPSRAAPCNEGQQCRCDCNPHPPARAGPETVQMKPLRNRFVGDLAIATLQLISQSTPRADALGVLRMRREPRLYRLAALRRQFIVDISM